MLAARVATIEDWPAILGMVRSYGELTLLPGSFDVDATRDIVSRLILAKTALVALRDETVAGACLLSVAPHLFSKSVIAQELMWWVNPEHRGTGVGAALLSLAEEVAREHGAVGMLMHSFVFGTEGAADSAFAKHGYSRIQTGWFKGVA